MEVTRKPPIYQAFEWTGENRDEIRMALTRTKWSTVQFVPEKLEIAKNYSDLYRRKVKTLHLGWYVVVSSKGKVWVYSPEEFAEDWNLVPND